MAPPVSSHRTNARCLPGVGAQDRAICLHFRFSAVAHPQWRTVPSSSWHCGYCVCSRSPTSSINSGSTSVCSATARLRNGVCVLLSSSQRCRGAVQTCDACGFVTCCLIILCGDLTVSQLAPNTRSGLNPFTSTARSFDCLKSPHHTIFSSPFA